MSIKSIIAKILIWAGAEAPRLPPARRQIVKLDDIDKTICGRNDFKSTGYIHHVKSLDVGDEVIFLVRERNYLVSLASTIQNLGTRSFGRGACRVTQDPKSLRISVIRIA